MDLTNQPNLIVDYELDEDTNILTATIKDASSVVLGTIVIENSKYRSLMRALTVAADERVTSLMPQVGYRVEYDIQSSSSEVKFG
jgi:hypothetical protein